MILGFDHYNLRSDRHTMEILKVFYRDVVGLTLGDRPPLRSFGYWLYAGGKDVLHLSETREGEQALQNVQTTFDHVAFKAAHVEKTIQHLQSLGIEFIQREIPMSGAVQIFFRDPAGNGVELNFAPDNIA